MNRLDQSRRDHRIAVDAATGATQATLASRYGVSERTVRRAIERARRADSGAHERLADFFSYVDSAIEQLAFERSEARSPRTRIAAIHRQVDLMKERQRVLLQPRGLTLNREGIRQLEFSFAAALIALAEKDGLDEGFQNWLRAAVGGHAAGEALRTESGHLREEDLSG